MRVLKNGRVVTFDLNGRFKIMSASNRALLGSELLTQVTELAHVVCSTRTVYFDYLVFMYC